MKVSRHALAQELFEQALELGEPERGALLERRCGGDPELKRLVEALLEVEARDADRLQTPAVAGLVPESRDTLFDLPEAIGSYRILSLLGAGGMGVVYEALQEKPERRVALKVLAGSLVSPEMQRRFETEGQVLAWLAHPGIATVFETGAAASAHGRELFVAMELVRGVPLDVYAKREKLSTRGILELLARVCDAVHHAHQKGVVHRDLKPANVLVEDDGQPKILDFGVARITDTDLARTRQTSAGEILGTLAYMSPEQVHGDPGRVDARSDVYALGVLLYELFAERHPLEVAGLSLPDAIRVIERDEPVPLGKLCPRLRGDVETIVHKALAKEHARRYESAAALAADLRRHLNEEPITARPATRTYKLQKFVRRHRTLVGSFATVLATLVVGLGVSLAFYFEKEDQRAEAERRGRSLAEALGTANANLERALAAEAEARDAGSRAALEAQTAQSVTDYLVTLFEYASPERSDSGQVTAEEILEQGVERIRDEFEDDPEIRARLLDVFGRIYNWMQRYAQARPVLEEALALNERLYGTRSTQYADTLERLAQVHYTIGSLSDSREMRRSVLEIREEVIGTDNALYTDAQINLANTLIEENEFDEARELLVSARENRVERLGEQHFRVALADYGLGTLETELGNYRKAAEYHERATGVIREHFGDLHWRSLTARVALADALRLCDRTDEALEHAKAGFEGLRTLFGEDSSMATYALRIFAVCLSRAGDLEEAVYTLEDLLAERELPPESDPQAPHILGSLAAALSSLGRYDEAEEIYFQALELSRRRESETGRLPLELRHNLSVLYQKTDRLDEALELSEAVLAIRERTLGLAHPDTRGTMNNLALIYGKLGRHDDEVALRRRKLAAVEEAYGTDSGEASLARRELERCLE